MSNKEGILIFDRQSYRYDIRFGLNSYYGGLHCGTTFDVLVNDEWTPTRIEYAEDWFLVGMGGIRLDGLRVRF